MTSSRPSAKARWRGSIAVAVTRSQNAWRSCSTHRLVLAINGAGVRRRRSRCCASAGKERDDDPSPGTRDAIGSTAAISADGKWKLIQNDVRPEGVPEVELYDRRGDPLDQHDVAAAHPDLVASLRGEIERWRADAARLALPKADAADALAPEEAERLRALGYGD